MAAASAKTFWLARAGREVEGPFTAHALWLALMGHRVESSDQVCDVTPKSHWHSLRFFFFWQLLGYYLIPKVVATAKVMAFFGVVGGGGFWWWQRHAVPIAANDARPDVIEQRHQAAVDAKAVVEQKATRSVVAEQRQKKQVATWAHKMATVLTLTVMRTSDEFSLCQNAKDPSGDPVYVIGLSGIDAGGEWRGVLYRCGTKDYQPESGPPKTVRLYARDPAAGYRLAAEMLSQPSSAAQ